MKRIIFVTSNQGKFQSAKNFLRKYKIKAVQKILDVPESRGQLEQIAAQKAKYAFKVLKKPVLAMDAGFFIPSLNGFPMMFTNFALETIGTEGILKLVRGKDRICEFREVLCYCDDLKRKQKLFERVVKGHISKKPFGNLQSFHWSKLALIFIPEGKNKTLAQMSKKEFDDFKKEVDKDSHWEQFAMFFLKINI